MVCDTKLPILPPFLPNFRQCHDVTTSTLQFDNLLLLLQLLLQFTLHPPPLAFL